MLGKERGNWHLYWQGELAEVDYKKPEIAPLLAYYYIVTYARPWAESILKDKGSEAANPLEEIEVEIASLELTGQTDKIDKGLREFDEQILANLPKNATFQRVKSFSVECARLLHETFIKVEAGKPTEGLGQDLGKAMFNNPNLAVSYSQILFETEEKDKAYRLLNSIYQAHRGFFLALREI